MTTEEKPFDKDRVKVIYQDGRVTGGPTTMTDVDTIWDKLHKLFPITKEEAEQLHALEWESGYGWKSTPDWFKGNIWLEDERSTAEAWMADLAAIRKAGDAGYRCFLLRKGCALPRHWRELAEHSAQYIEALSSRCDELERLAGDLVKASSRKIKPALLSRIKEDAEIVKRFGGSDPQVKKDHAVADATLALLEWYGEAQAASAPFQSKGE